MTYLLNAALLCVVILLLWPRPIRQTVKYAVLAAAVCGIVCGVILIQQKMEEDTVFSVKALDSRNDSAEGSEIWIKSVVVDGVEQAPETVFSWGWIMEDGYLKWRDYDKPEYMTDTVYATIPGRHDVDILFQSNKWRGIAEVSEGKLITLMYNVDCYADTSEDEYPLLSFQEGRMVCGIRVEGKILCVCMLTFLLVTAGACSLVTKWRSLRGITEKTEGVRLAEREVWLDLLKAMAAPLLVITHVVGSGFSNTPVESAGWLGYLIINAIPRCAVPLFIMISGILLIGRETSKEKVLRNVKKALMLLVVWNIFYILLQAILWGPEENIWQQIFGVLVKRGPAGHLWYSYFLVWMYLFTPIISTLYKALSERMRLYFVLLTVLIPGVLDLYLKVFSISSGSSLYAFQMYMTLNYMGMMFLGRLIYEKALYAKKPATVYAGSAMIGLCALVAGTYIYCCYHGSATDMFMAETQLLPVVYGAGLLGLASEYRDRLQQMTRYVRWAVEWLAQHALGIYFIHVFNIWTIGSIHLGDVTISAENSVLQTLFLCGLYYMVSVVEVILMDKVSFLRKLVM